MIASLRTSWQAYKGQPTATRLHVAVRVLTCPFAGLIAHFPKTGKVLDVGCGHGLLINLLARDPDRQGLRLHGIDHDADKIAIARNSAPAGVDFSTRTLAGVDEVSCDIVTLVDVLYTINSALWPVILAGCYRVLRPGGLLILKEVVDRPRWKYWAIMAQEVLAVRVFSITKGEAPHFESTACYCRSLTQAGFRVEQAAPLPAGNWVSHYLFMAKKL
ncbi:MAG: hypothetical protein BWK76_28010 [Desulfobulbaceae bacterium A2]|nr:MAG: hypothetical protein BWK76_28010 [Desulfobulbaceae bacterium A2]